jgi:hypothetical protein
MDGSWKIADVDAFMSERRARSDERRRNANRGIVDGGVLQLREELMKVWFVNRRAARALQLRSPCALDEPIIPVRHAGESRHPGSTERLSLSGYRHTPV